jgi:uncharacterized protein YdaL
MKGMLYEEERKARRLDSQCKGGILLIRQLLNPYEDNVCNLDIEAAKAAMDTLNKDSAELKAAKEKIKRLKEDLE